MVQPDYRTLVESGISPNALNRPQSRLVWLQIWSWENLAYGLDVLHICRELLPTRTDLVSRKPAHDHRARMEPDGWSRTETHTAPAEPRRNPPPNVSSEFQIDDEVSVPPVRLGCMGLGNSKSSRCRNENLQFTTCPVCIFTKQTELSFSAQAESHRQKQRKLT